VLQNIGRYEIEKELGKGAMGLVYKATDPNIGRPVALKTMRLDVHGIEQEEMLRRFKNEARSAGVLGHPNIVTIYDAGEDQGLFYIAMEYIEGQTLAEVLQQHRVLPVDQVIAITRNICSGLDFAHAKGIVHRDIKPANIMITPEGTAKIMDFGIAKVSGSLTSTGQVLGTPNYMSPEQVKGRQLDGRSDLFSLGVMLYEMLTGEKPFIGQGVTTIIYKIVNENPIPPRDLDLTIHPGLSAVVTRTLSKDPYERYQTGSELIRDLENYKSYGSDANSTIVNSTGIFDRALAGATSGDATLIGTAPAAAFKGATTPVTPPAPAQEAASSTGTQSAKPATQDAPTGKTPALGTQKTVPPVVPPKTPTAAAAKPASAGSRGSGKLLIGALAVLVLVAGVFGIARHNAKKRAERQQAEYQQAMQQAQQAIEVAKEAEQLNKPADPPPTTTETPTETPSSAGATIPTPPEADANSAKAPAAPAAPKIKPKPVTGDLQIVSDPVGARVEIDGQTRPEWVTPFLADKLTPGKHNITYNLPNFNSEKRTADVVAGKKGSVEAKLTTSVGTVKLASTPAGAEVLLNGKPTGQKTPATLNLPPGNHTLKIHHEGFQDDTQNVTVALGQTQNVTSKLQPVPAPAPTTAAAKPNTPAQTNPFSKIGRFFKGGSSDIGTLAITTKPAGAKIIVNGEASSSVTPVTIQTKVGHYKVVVEMEGYQPVTREVNVEKGKQTGIDETLVRK
jgi:serine/threonine-protein kinase